LPHVEAAKKYFCQPKYETEMEISLNGVTLKNCINCKKQKVCELPTSYAQLTLNGRAKR